MKSATLLITSILLLAVCVHSQDNTDSLRHVISSNRPYEEQIKASIRLLENFEEVNFDSTIIAAEKALALARKNKDSVGVAVVKRHIGVASFVRGKYDAATASYFESIRILEREKDARRLAPVYYELAKLYYKLGKRKEADENFEKAKAIFLQLKDTAGIAMMNKSGETYHRNGDYKEALKIYKASMELALSVGDSLSVSNSLRSIAVINMSEQKFGEAEKNLLRALDYRKSREKDSLAIAMIYSELGTALSGKKDYERANEFLLTSNKIAERLRYTELLSVNYTELASVAQKRGKFQEAYDYFLKRSFLRDSIIDLENTKQIEEIRAQYETEEKEQRIKQQDERLRLQNYIFIGIGGLILLLGLLVHSQYRRNKLRQETKLKTQLMQQQENAVKAVIEAEENERQRIAKDLHDGVGQMMSAAKMNLSAFESGMAFSSEEQKQTFEKIISLVDDSCKEVRTVSHVMMPNALLKNNLPTAIREFVDKLNSKNINVHVYTDGLDERMDSNIETVLYRVVQECVTNAIRHASASTLDITLARDNDGITGTIEDNGKGFETEGKEKFDGIGLKNIVSRIEYLKGTVDFDSAPGRGTVIAFHVPI